MSFMGKGRTKRSRLRKQVLSPVQEKVMRLGHKPEFINILQWMHSQTNTNYYKSGKNFSKKAIVPAEFYTGSGESNCSYRGISSSKRIPQGSTILHLPDQLLITSDNFDKSVSKSVLAELSIHEQFVVFLLQELEKGADSFYFPYIQTLPSSQDFFSHPSYLENADKIFLNCLPTEIKRALQEQQDLIHSCFKKVKVLMPNVQWNYEYCKWLWLVVNTRTVFYQKTTGEKEMALAPFLDLINHSPSPNTSVHFIVSGESRGYLIEAVRDIEINEQVFISYGSHPNYKLWIDYGFIPFQLNPDDFVPLDFGYLCHNFHPFSILKRDKRRQDLVDKCSFHQELNFMERDVSTNLVLLVGIILWDPDKDGHFGFKTDLESDPQLKNIIVQIIDFELDLYQTALSVSINAQSGNNSVYNGAIDSARTYLEKAIQLMSNLRTVLVWICDCRS